MGYMRVSIVHCDSTPGKAGYVLYTDLVDQSSAYCYKSKQNQPVVRSFRSLLFSLQPCPGFVRELI